MKKNLLLLLGMLVLQNTTAAVIDNRYFPWNNPPIIHSLEPYSGVTSNLFFVFADEAYASGSKDKRGIPEIWGLYDEKQMSDALLFIGQTTPLLAQWQLLRNIEWHVKQKIEGQGIQITGEHAIYKDLSFGYTLGYMHLFSDQLFSIPKRVAREMAVTPAQEEELDRERREMFDQLGLATSQYSASGLLDTTLYFRFGKAWEYQAKCREVSLNVFGGIILPSGQVRHSSNTGSIPFGGNGAFGYFAGTDNSFELKEDMTVGFWLELSARRKKTIHERLPVKQENYLFGALTGDVSIDPGLTTKIRPYLFLGNLRDGFDVCIQYSYTNHQGDVWVDARKDQTIPSNLNGLFKKSEWESDYVSLTVLYDSGKVVKRDSLHPSLRFSWDIPMRLLTAHEVSRTHAISLGIEICF
jgi:hypothetical protein